MERESLDFTALQCASYRQKNRMVVLAEGQQGFLEAEAFEDGEAQGLAGTFVLPGRVAHAAVVEGARRVAVVLGDERQGVGEQVVFAAQTRAEVGQGHRNRLMVSGAGLARGPVASGVALALGEGGLLFRARFFLVLGFPLGIGHAVDLFAGLVIADFHPEVVGGGLVPLGQAVAAETGEVHQVDVLHVLAGLQMMDQGAEGGGFEFQALLFGEVGCGHGGVSRRWLGAG